jgi:membrane-bound metal-dependent hydrolase YbcI (DUF457 family)
MAVNKSHNQLALLAHGLTYGAVLTVGLLFYSKSITYENLALFILLNTSAHILTDMITSKMTSFLYKKDQTYLFFMVIGLDQFIHTATLLLSYQTFFEK